MKLSRFLLSSILCCLSLAVSAQYLENPSFEGEPIQDFPPSGWATCDPGSSPDTQPGAYGVDLQAQDGTSYLGLVSRGAGGPFPNRTEDVSTVLLQPLQADKRYVFTVQLAFFENLGHEIPWNGQYQAYDQPLQLEIWGNNNLCQEEELLWRSPVIAHSEWKEYSTLIIPHKPLSQLLLKASFVAPDEHYFGNIMLDALSLQEAPASLMIPNVFTPNDDGTLDLFQPFDVEDVAQYQVQVFDRWGRLVFQAQDPNQGWDGYCSGQPCPEGTYFWTVEFANESGEQIIEKGSLSLLR